MTVVFAPTARDAERFRFTLATDITPVASVTELEDTLAANAEENLVVVSPDIDWRVVLDVAERYRVARPDVGFIVLRRRMDVASLTQAIRAGVREVVDTDDAAALVEACRRSQEVSSRLVKSTQAARSPHLRGRLITVFSPKGGTGKTMLATNLAVALAKQQFRTCLIDLDLQFGDVAIALRLEPTRTTADALGLRDAIDEHALTSLLLPYRTNLSVLPGPTRPADAEFITADLVTTLLDGLLAMHDVVIVDTPPAFNDTVLRALDMSDVHLLITTPDLASLKSVRVALDTLNALGYPASKRQVILNRDESNIGLTQGDIRDILHMPITARIPAHRDVVLALNHGTTVVESNPRSPVSRSITRIANDLSTILGTPAGAAEAIPVTEVAVG
jgi:pilus assembly protein CpaE